MSVYPSRVLSCFQNFSPCTSSLLCWLEPKPSHPVHFQVCTFKKSTQSIVWGVIFVFSKVSGSFFRDTIADQNFVGDIPWLSRRGFGWFSGPIWLVCVSGSLATYPTSLARPKIVGVIPLCHNRFTISFLASFPVRTTTYFAPNAFFPAAVNTYFPFSSLFNGTYPTIFLVAESWAASETD